jgi:hypothetical protein
MEKYDVYPSNKRTQFTQVKDKNGNEFLCATDALKDPKKVSNAELKNCIDSSTVLQPSAGG